MQKNGLINTIMYKRENLFKDCKQQQLIFVSFYNMQVTLLYIISIHVLI